MNRLLIALLCTVSALAGSLFAWFLLKPAAEVELHETAGGQMEAAAQRYVTEAESLLSQGLGDIGDAMNVLQLIDRPELLEALQIGRLEASIQTSWQAAQVTNGLEIPLPNIFDAIRRARDLLEGRETSEAVLEDLAQLELWVEEKSAEASDADRD
ncbi:MAG: hypothetical protein AAF690_06910 [Acidobacteriota bacterium]